MRCPSRSRLLLFALLGTALIAGGAAASWQQAAPEKASPAVVSGWSFAAPMLHRRSYAASAQSGGDIYVAAGMVGNTGRPLDLFERFDPGKNRWVSLQPLPTRFSAGAAATVGRTIYVVGGDSDETDGRQVYTYTIGTHRWRSVTPLPAVRTNLAVVSLRGKIYALGGLDPVHPTRTVYVLDPVRARWTQAAPLPNRLHGLGAVVFKGEIWTIGGRNTQGRAVRQVWIYNPRRDSWRAGPTLPEAMDIPGVTVAGQQIHAIVDTINVVYDAADHRWHRGPTLQVPRHALALFTYRKQLYAVGGCASPQLVDSQVVETMRAATPADVS